MSRRIIAVVPDLFFSTRILATARTVGVPVDLLPLPRALAACIESLPALVLIDLHANGDPMALVRALKQDERTRGIPLVGFYSHIETALRRAALEAGIDEAMPRSAFTRRLPELLSGAPLVEPAEEGVEED
ncbi:MAG: hypothetical protein ABIU54_02045 [Candidatus Eisenbacteria bacterium]